MLPKANKADMTGTMEAIKEYLRSCHDVIRAPPAHTIRKAIIVQAYGDFYKYAIPDNEIITRMLHISSDKNRLQIKQSAQLVQEHTTAYTIDNRSVYDIFGQICKDTQLYLYIKQHKSKRDGTGAFYVIHSRWLGPNHVNVTDSEAELVLQMLMYNRKKKAHIKYHIILGNQMEYGYQGLDPSLKV